MPTANPRLTVTLTPSVAAVMRRLSDATGNSQSALVGELLEQSLPLFERMVKLLEAASGIKGKVQADIVADLEGIQTRLEQQLGLGLDSMDRQTAALIDQAERVTRRSTSGGGAERRGSEATQRRPTTPMSNRGVTPLVNQEKRRTNGTAVGRRRSGRSGPL